MEELKEKIKISVKGKSYELSFPNVGQFRTIETMKSMLSGGTYGMLNVQKSPSSDKALNMIDVEAYFSVLAPELVKDLKCSFGELGYADYLELEKIYSEEFLPWYQSWMKKFRNVE